VKDKRTEGDIAFGSGLRDLGALERDGTSVDSYIHAVDVQEERGKEEKGFLKKSEERHERDEE